MKQLQKLKVALAVAAILEVQQVVGWSGLPNAQELKAIPEGGSQLNITVPNKLPPLTELDNNGNVIDSNASDVVLMSAMQDTLLDSAREFLNHRNQSLIIGGMAKSLNFAHPISKILASRNARDESVLRERAAKLDALGEMYTDFSTDVRLVHVRTVQGKIVALIEETTKFDYAQVHGDEPPFTAFQVEREFVFQRDISGRWILDDVQYLGEGMAPPMNEAEGTTRSFSSDCTNFISQAMYAGGWTMVYGSYYLNSSWWYNWLHQSYPWAGAENWYWFARGRGRTTYLSNVWYMQLGDVLQTDWQKDGTIDHTMIVTRVTTSDRFLTYHSNNVLNRSLKAIIAQSPNAWYYAHRTL